ncbi:unnamed protein product, partial [marine sediment metagenome]|jgi:hypothetical protein
MNVFLPLNLNRENPYPAIPDRNTEIKVTESETNTLFIKALTNPGSFNIFLKATKVIFSGIQ